MSQIDPQSREMVPQEQAMPAPPPAPEGWFAPPPPYMPPTPAPRPTWGRWLAVGTIVATILAAGGGIGIGFTMSQYLHSTHANQSAALPKVNEPPTSTAPITPVNPINPRPAQNGTLNAQAIAAKVDPAIVDINTVVQTSSGSGAAAGTGMIITSSGEVLTNNHVVDGSTSITVTISGHPGTYTAHVIGVSPTADVALIQIEGVSGLPTVTLADSSSVKPGDPVVAIGNALGAGGAPSVTQGQVNAIDQTITASEGNGRSEVLSGMIQEDASIQPGDSGGALVNSSGQVIGMITAGEAQGFRSSSSTVGYAISTNSALAVVNQIRSGQPTAGVFIGPVGYMGVSIRDLTPAIAAQNGISSTSGPLVWAVQAGSPAEQAGITRLSVITAVGGTAVDSSATLGDALHAYKPGASVAVTWVDQNGGSHTKNVILTTGPNI
jgi:S1-C subfamily serine protease